MNLLPSSNTFASLIILLSLSVCSPPSEQHESAESDQPENSSIEPVEISQAQLIVDEAIVRHGGNQYNRARIEFDFRGRHYTSTRSEGDFVYERIFNDTVSDEPVVVTDMLDNDGFKRMIGSVEMDLRDDFKQRYSMSVNSVLYFVQLPFGLNDPAVLKTYLGEVDIKGQPYHKIQVNFRKDGGGVDFEDVFIYWFHKENKTMDYLAYSYLTEGGGLRFREAYNQRNINGIQFADYINYKADHNKYILAETDSLFTEGQLEELSRIDSEDITVSLF